ncbi:MAG TPA: glucose-6-phosphate dehydrogenase [Aestuariivirgaceae bacterium]|nr:glucose-6-phosphate dehydrogenase [Aestuariivirgaceae bacterium]
MTAQIIPVQPFDLVVFGGTGDLASRKLMPALYYRDRDGQLPAEARVVGLSRQAMDDAAYRKRVDEALARYVPAGDLEPAVRQRFLARIHYVQLDITQEQGWKSLDKLLNGGSERIRVFYLATAPDLFGAVAKHLGAYRLMTPTSRVVLEKPIGHDLASARAINDEVGHVFPERQIYRIDHYLGKETVQNLMALRFANSMFEPVWNHGEIDHVQITVAETVGVEGRAAYYNSSGALRDMVQNHMIQLLCLVAMEAPQRFEADAVRDEKMKVLRGLRPLRGHDVHTHVVRGQYSAGAISGVAVPGFAEEVGAPTQAETFVAIKASIDNWRWAGVHFYLRTGKRLPHRVSEIVVQFRNVPHSIFGHDVGRIEPNRLVLRLQPDEGVQLQLMSKDPGPGGMRLKETPLNLSFAEAFKTRWPDAYERLLLDVVRGNATLFMRRDEVEAAWEWIEPIHSEWETTAQPPLCTYPAGSWGPPQSVVLMARDGGNWVDPVA